MWKMCDNSELLGGTLTSYTLTDYSNPIYLIYAVFNLASDCDNYTTFSQMQMFGIATDALNSGWIRLLRAN